MTNLTDIVVAGHSVSSHPVPDGCSQIFAPCLDPHCQRPCGARQEPPMHDHIKATHRYFIAMALTTIIGLALIVGMAAWSMPWVERATQEDMP